MTKMTDSGRYHFEPNTEERIGPSAPRLKAASEPDDDDDFELYSPIGEEDDDEPTLATRAALNRLDAAVDDAAEVCEVIGRKSLELRRRMRRKRIDSAQKFAAMVSRHSSHPPVGATDR